MVKHLEKTGETKIQTTAILQTTISSIRHNNVGMNKSRY